MTTYELYPFQQVGRDFLADDDPNHCLVLDDMGLGKTPQILRALGNQALLVCPSSLKGGWANECRVWRPDLTPIVLNGEGSFRWPEPGELVIVNFAILPPCMWEVTQRRKKLKKVKAKLDKLGALMTPRKLAANERIKAKLESEIAEILPRVRALPKPPEGIDIAADEIHLLASNKSDRTQRFRRLRRAVVKQGGRVMGGTGTPLLNRQLDLWNLLTTFGAHKHAFGGWSGFLNVFRGKKTRIGLKWGKPDANALREAMRRVAIRRLKSRVLKDLPPLRERRLPVGIEENRARLDALSQQLDIDLSSASVTAVQARFEEIGFERLSHLREQVAVAKIPALLELIESHESAGSPLLVVTDHKAVAKAVGGRDGWFVIHGEVPGAKRTEIQDRFQAGEGIGIALTIKAAGVGLTLTRASEVIFNDRSWTPGINRQARDRVYRIGQVNPVVVTHLIADHPLDERLDEVTSRKDELEEALDAMAEDE